MNTTAFSTHGRWLAAGLMAVLTLGATAVGAPRVCADVMTSNPDGIAQADISQSRWYVYRDGGASDNHGQWTFYLVDPTIPPARVAQAMNNILAPNLVYRPGPHEGTTCAKFDIHLQAEFQWVGLAVTGPNYQQARSGLAFDLKGAFDLSKARRLVFWARGERGNEYVQVKVAVFAGVPNGDSAQIPAATRWIPLTTVWTRYELELAGMNLTRVVSPFVFVVDKAHNPGGAVTFYVGDVYFEMGR